MARLRNPVKYIKDLTDCRVVLVCGGGKTIISTATDPYKAIATPTTLPRFRYHLAAHTRGKVCGTLVLVPYILVRRILIHCNNYGTVPMWRVYTNFRFVGIGTVFLRKFVFAFGEIACGNLTKIVFCKNRYRTYRTCQSQVTKCPSTKFSTVMRS